MSLSFLGFLEEYKNEKELSQLVHMGTCGLHTSQFYETWRKSIWLELKKLIFAKEYLMSHHLEELIMRQLLKQYIQTTYCISVREQDRFGPKLLKPLTFEKVYLKAKSQEKESLEQTADDHLYLIQKDPLVQLQLFEDNAKTQLFSSSMPD